MPGARLVYRLLMGHEEAVGLAVEMLSGRTAQRPVPLWCRASSSLPVPCLHCCDEEIVIVDDDDDICACRSVCSPSPFAVCSRRLPTKPGNITSNLPAKHGNKYMHQICKHSLARLNTSRDRRNTP